MVASTENNSKSGYLKTSTTDSQKVPKIMDKNSNVICKILTEVLECPKKIST